MPSLSFGPPPTTARQERRGRPEEEEGLSLPAEEGLSLEDLVAIEKEKLTWSVAVFEGARAGEQLVDLDPISPLTCPSQSASAFPGYAPDSPPS